MEIRAPFKIQRIEIDGEPYSLYILSYTDSQTLEMKREIGIGPIEAEGSIAEKVARKIADKYSARVITANFGGESAGNPPILRTLFALPVSERMAENIIRRIHLEKMEEEISKEFSEAKSRLIEVATEYERAIKKIVDSILFF
jgi:hypothetical protein